MIKIPVKSKKNIILRGSDMRASILLFITLLVISVNAQSKFEVGRVISNKYVITTDTTILIKALQSTLGDGTSIRQVHIESENTHHYIVGEGIYRGYYKMIAVSLMYDIRSRTYYVIKGSGYVSCSAAACISCKRFTEKGKIIGCKCEEKSTISNQCNFTFKETSTFFGHLKRHAISNK